MIEITIQNLWMFCYAILTYSLYCRFELNILLSHQDNQLQVCKDSSSISKITWDYF